MLGRNGPWAAAPINRKDQSVTATRQRTMRRKSVALFTSAPPS